MSDSLATLDLLSLQIAQLKERFRVIIWELAMAQNGCSLQHIEHMVMSTISAELELAQRCHHYRRWLFRQELRGRPVPWRTHQMDADWDNLQDVMDYVKSLASRHCGLRFDDWPIEEIWPTRHFSLN